MNLIRPLLMALVGATTFLGVQSIANPIDRAASQTSNGFPQQELGNRIPQTFSEDDLKKYIQHTAEVLDCISVSPRGCSHVYPQSPGIELCSVTGISNHKAEGRLISGPDLGWNGAGRYMGVAVGIKVAGDPILNNEAYYIFHIGMNVYPKNLAPELVHALRGYCTGQPNIIGGNNSYTHCVCGVGPGGTRQEYCHVYENGRLVDTQPGSGGLCSP